MNQFILNIHHNNLNKNDKDQKSAILETFPRNSEKWDTQTLQK